MALAGALDRKLVLMIAAYISDIPEHGPWSEEMVRHPRDICTAYLTGVRERTGAANAELVVKVGYPHEMVLETAREAGASVIVLSTHGRSGFGRWLYGSTAGHLLHASHVPLFVIGKEVPAATTFAPKKLMVPLDGSSLGESALPAADQLARAFGAQLTLVRVAPFSVEAFPMTVPALYWPNLDEELVASATAYLERIRGSVSQPVEVKVLQGARADGLLEVADRGGIDLVVMTTHGRAGVQRALLGSTADRMLQGRAPVLLLRPGEKASS
jgi:nucleotide-binding universal stress UspA family protein